jgi:hypothetical protein
LHLSKSIVLSTYLYFINAFLQCILERVNLDIVGDMKQKAIKYEKVEKYIKSKFQEATTGTSLL